MARFSTKQLTKTYSKWGKGAYSTGYKKSYGSYSNSSFWMDDDFLEDDSTKLAANRVRVICGIGRLPTDSSSWCNATGFRNW